MFSEADSLRDEHMVVFKLRLEQTYWLKGFFNVPVDYERFLSDDDGPVDIFLGTRAMSWAGPSAPSMTDTSR